MILKEKFKSINTLDYKKEINNHIRGSFRSIPYFRPSSSEKNSKLTLTKRYDGESASKTGTFSVEKGVTKIRLELYMPGKKELKKLTIDDSADIMWSQSISVPEGDTKYYGEWTYVINAQEARGKYNLSLSTY